MTPQRTSAEIEADLVQARAKLQSTVDDLATRLDPKTNAKKLGLAAASPSFCLLYTSPSPRDS